MVSPRDGTEKRIVQRRYAPKVRSGCVTCKIRRVKCDEAKPFCKRCTSTGRKCDGYNAPPETASRSPESPSSALTLDTSFDALERRTFEFFRIKTAPCISGYFADPVWDRFVLQLAQSEPTIRHAVVALGALHEEQSLRIHAGPKLLDGAKVKSGFPLVQYSKALQGLQSMLQSDNAPMDIILMCCLIMIHFESLRECFVPTLLHVENAIRIAMSNVNFDARKVDPAIIRSLQRIDLQGSIYIGMRAPSMSLYMSSVESPLPSSFHDLTQARDTVNTWSGRLFHFLRTECDELRLRDPGSVPLETLHKAHEFCQIFVDLEKALWDFMHKPSAKMTTREQQGLGMLRARAKLNRVQAACGLYAEESIYDAFLTEFEEIMVITRWIMESDNNDRRLFSVSIDEGLLHPLLFTALHCRDGNIRHQAVATLKKLPLDQGIYHVEAITRTADLCCRFEEAHCDQPVPRCSDIPEWRRIHSAGFDNWRQEGAAQSIKIHLRLRPNGIDGEWADFAETIERLGAPIPVDIKELYGMTGQDAPGKQAWP